MSKPVYLDYNATTPTDPRVLRGNASIRAASTLEIPAAITFTEEGANSRWMRPVAGIARYLRPQPEEIVFTSGATESNNLVLLGLAEPWPTTRSNAHPGLLDRARFRPRPPERPLPAGF